MLVSADEVDLAILRGSRTVHVVVPPVRAEDVVACVERVLLEREAARVDQIAAAPAADPGTSSGTTPTADEVPPLRPEARPPAPPGPAGPETRAAKPGPRRRRPAASPPPSDEAPATP